MYYNRLIDSYLEEWAKRPNHKPVLLRGARQVGKSTAIRHLGDRFENYVEINLEKNPEYKILFQGNLDVKRIVPQIAAMYGQAIIPGKTLLFIDEIQECPEAIMSLRYFKEDFSELHIISAGSLLEFALDELPTFGVGRIHSMFMYPMTFDEFLMANGDGLLLNARKKASAEHPLAAPLHEKLIQQFRTYMIIGGMPEAVARWVETHDFLQCQEVQDDILTGYEDDFPKYRKKVSPVLLRQTLHSVAAQVTQKFVYANVGGGYKAVDIKIALDLLTKAGIIVPVAHTSANGLPLGGETNLSYRKFLLLDSGLLLRLLNITLGNASNITTHILTSSVSDLVNKGPMSEMIVGLEMLHYLSPNIQHDLYYWVRLAKNSLAEVDYVTSRNSTVLPIEVKAGAKGGMKSLWSFMREKHLTEAVRCSLENFSTFEFVDAEDANAVRRVQVLPIYAVSQING